MLASPASRDAREVVVRQDPRRAGPERGGRFDRRIELLALERRVEQLEREREVEVLEVRRHVRGREIDLADEQRVARGLADRGERRAYVRAVPGVEVLEP